MILVEDLHRVFDMELDKVASPYFTSADKDLFLNKGVDDFISRFFKNPSIHIAEDTQVDLEYLYELIYETVLTTDTLGKITYADIDASLPAGKERNHFLNVRRGATIDCGDNTVKCRWVRHNDLSAIKGNEFKKPTDAYPIWLHYGTYIQLEPKKAASALITVLMKPNKVDLDDPTDSGNRGPGAVDLDMPEKCLNEIVHLAMVHAGVNIREYDLAQMAKMEAEGNA